jgi:hypothetical protein
VNDISVHALRCSGRLKVSVTMASPVPLRLTASSLYWLTAAARSAAAAIRGLPGPPGGHIFSRSLWSCAVAVRTQCNIHSIVPSINTLLHHRAQRSSTSALRSAQ